MPKIKRLTARENGHAYFPVCFEEPCCGNGCTKANCDFFTKVCNRLCDLEELIETNCSVTSHKGIGSKLYAVLCDDGTWKICEVTVTEVGMKHFFISAFDPPENDMSDAIPFSEIGDTFFLSEEEAEKALWERSSK